MNNNQGKSTHGGKRPGAGRPKGRVNKVTADVREAALVYSAEALDTLASIMRSTEEAAAARVAAAKELLDRAHGKSRQAIVGDDDAAPIKHEFTWLSAGS